jgi:hypothetical protein
MMAFALSDGAFIEKLEQIVDRKLKPRKPGPQAGISKVSPEFAPEFCPPDFRIRITEIRLHLLLPR